MRILIQIQNGLGTRKLKSNFELVNRKLGRCFIAIEKMHCGPTKSK